MNRTDRLYALVEELRAVAPRARTAKVLAERFEVSVRTVERDLLALLEAGVPIHATPGPGGGYALDKRWTLPPINFTPAEVTAIAVALGRPGASPFGIAGRSALQKVVAAMAEGDAEAARRLVGRVRLLDRDDVRGRPVDPLIEEAVVSRRVVVIGYTDRNGGATERAVEPVALVGAGPHWYLVGWCRLRQDGRLFRHDRIRSVRLTKEVARERDFRSVAGDIADAVSSPALLE